ncbi:MAG TPA: WD40 repeat domain-containing protein [Bellilinea sp.]|nr:WD40 repeat domain-containing protein [Bellilinea sp.]
MEANTGTTLNTIQAFPDNVRSLAWSPDGAMLAVGSDQPQVKVWDVVKGKIIVELKGDRSSINSLAWSPDGKNIAGGTFIGNVILWPASGGEQIAFWKSPAGFSVYDLAWKSDSSLLYAAVSFTPGCGEGCNPVYDGFVAMLARDSLSPLGEWDANDPVFSLEQGPDGENMAVGLRKGEVKILSEDLNPIQTIATNIWTESGVVWLPSGEIIFLKKGETLGSVLNSPPFPAVISPEMVIQWNPVTGDQIEVELPGEESVSNPSWSPTGRFLTFSTPTGKILSYDAVSGIINTPLVHEGGYGPVAWSPDSLRYAYLEADGKVIIKNLSSGDIEAELVGGKISPTRLMWSSEGSFLAGANWETVNVWDIMSGEIVLEQDGLSPNTVAWSPNSTWLAFAGGTNGSEIVIWDVLCNCLVKEIDVDGWVTSLDWAANSDVNRLAVALGGWGEVWDVDTGQMLFRTPFKSHSWGIDAAAISPDGSILATSAAEIILWNINTGAEQMRLEGHSDTVTDIVFQPDGKLLATSSHSGVIMLWDIEN